MFCEEKEKDLFRGLFCYLIEGLHRGDLGGIDLIPLFILPFRDFVNPKWLHCRKQPVIMWHNFTPFVVKSVVKIQGCFHCPTK
jgi:hypothetical protein